MTVRRYFFNLVGPGLENDDLQGRELLSVDPAKQEAVRYAADIMRDDPDITRNTGALLIAVSDGLGSPLFSVSITVTDAPAQSGV